ncbi:MAG TPA: fibronectin type III domain-containing protein [Streptosporangiaceae bacterium]|nr:fibronectin type III domain-containing protein [Streptosporangiaceae bacterium]
MAEPVSPAPRRRRRRRGWAIFAAATVVVLALTAGVVIWAPWRAPPLLRPGGLKPGTSTAGSVVFHWSDPATGPLPDSYQILSSGKVLGTVPGSVTSYRAAGLAPDTAYQYRVAALRGGKRSSLSAVLTVNTTAPPVAAARWQGPWSVNIKIVKGAGALRGRGAKGWIESWRATPQCPAGPCTVLLTGDLNRHAIKATLTRAGQVYTGTTTANVFRCGKPADSVPIRATLTIRVTLTSAQPAGHAWVASAWHGGMVIASPYTSTSTFYCNAFRLTTSLSSGF